MIKVALVRGKYLNAFEGQNFDFSKSKTVKLTGISSLIPLHTNLPFPLKKHISLIDFLDNRAVKFIANRSIGDLQILFGLEKERNNFDLFHTADPHYYYSYQLAKLRNKGKISFLISTVWNTIPFNNEGTHSKRTIKRFTQKNTDLFITPTQRAKDALVKEGINSKRILVLPVGVDLKRFKPKNTIGNKVNLLFVGRMVEEKGGEDLIRAFKMIQPEIKKKVRLTMIGEGPMKGKEKLAEYKKASYGEIHNYFQKADVVVIPSKATTTWEEQYGMVAVEAMASGKAIVAYSSGALGEVIGNAGILVKEGDVKGLKEAFVRLIKDQPLRRRLGKIARRRAVEKFDSKKINKQYEQLYETLGHNTFQK